MSPSFTTSQMTGADLRHARALLGMTQVEMGARLGITGLEVSRKERGDRPIVAVQAAAIAGMLLARALEIEGRDPAQILEDFTESRRYQI